MHQLYFTETAICIFCKIGSTQQEVEGYKQYVHLIRKEFIKEHRDLVFTDQETAADKESVGKLLKLLNVLST